MLCTKKSPLVLLLAVMIILPIGVYAYASGLYTDKAPNMLFKTCDDDHLTCSRPYRYVPYTPSPCPTLPGSDYKQMDTHLTSGATCRGACGPDCTTCSTNYHTELCINYESSHKYCYYPTRNCGVNDGCKEHDACYDTCASNDETQLCYFLGICHCICDINCTIKYDPLLCLDWISGKNWLLGPNAKAVEYVGSPSLGSMTYPGPCP